MASLVMLSSVLLLLLLLPSSMANNILYGGETLRPGQSLTEGTFTFTMQPNCNLVLAENGHSVWSTSTGGRGINCYFSAQTDGNLVIYDREGRVIWSSGTWSSRGGPYALVLQRNRNVVWFNRRWDTNTFKSGGVVIAERDLNNTSITAEVPVADELTNRKIDMVTNN